VIVGEAPALSYRECAALATAVLVRKATRTFVPRLQPRQPGSLEINTSWRLCEGAMPVALTPR
jgi:hypothetical protein